MYSIPDAPWIRDAERYGTDYTELDFDSADEEDEDDE